MPNSSCVFVGTLPPGATAPAHLTVCAKAKGRGHLLFAGLSAADRGCESEADARQPALATLTSVKAAPKPGPDDDGNAPIANTGGPDADPALLGGLLVLAGAPTTAPVAVGGKFR